MLFANKPWPGGNEAIPTVDLCLSSEETPEAILDIYGRLCEI